MNKMKMSTLIRTILQLLAYANQVIAVLGSTTFATSPAYQWISVAVTIVITVLSYWYNNDWTNLAKATGDIFDMVKDGSITEEEVQKFINDHKKVDE